MPQPSKTRYSGVGIMEGIAAATWNGVDPKVQIAVGHALTLRNLAGVFEKIGLYSQSLVSQGAEVLGQLKQCQAERRQLMAEDPGEAGRRSAKTGVAVG